jgi:hypothetical protein
MFKKILLAGLIAASFAAVPLAALARTVVITTAPPELRQEVIPAPRRGSEWAPGHWEWRQRQHVWVGGHWLRARRGYAYESPRWIENNGRWRMEQGRWARTARDRDGDGVPNRMDQAPNNPNRN